MVIQFSNSYILKEYIQYELGIYRNKSMEDQSKKEIIRNLRSTENRAGNIKSYPLQKHISYKQPV